MSRNEYGFHEQLSVGKRGEEVIRQWLLSKGYHVSASSTREQEQGIDFIVTDPKGKIVYLEVKTDVIAARTGNLFIETLSSIQSGKLSWLYTSKADFILFYVPEQEDIFLVPTGKLRYRFQKEWAKRQWRQVANHGYDAIGVTVSLPEMGTIAKRFHLPKSAH